ncbi:MAG TPA: anti-sigma factor [Brevundimonas sp.]|jgi:anti-sigma-K factor RskA
MTDIQPTASTPDQEAAEYALGVTTAAQRQEAERRMASDPAFAGLVTAWDERLAPLIDSIPETAPPRVVWMRIAAQLGLAPRTATGGVWSNLNVWRTATGVFAVAAAASMAILLVYPKPVQTPAVVQPAAPEANLTSVGLLKGETGPATFVVTLDRANKRLIIAPVSSASPTGHSFEMWVLPKGQNPISLGAMDGREVVTIDTDKLIGPDGSRANLAVSVEPLGGSPTGLPTGPVVASGQLQPI